MGVLGSYLFDCVLHGARRWPSSRSLGGTTLSPEGTLLSYYSLRRKDLPSLLEEAWALQPVLALEDFMSLLERRLDTVVFRMGFAESIPEARSLVSRGHILINRYPPKSVRMILWPGDVVHFTRKPDHPHSAPLHCRQRPLPSYLKFLNPWTTDRGMMLSLPNLGYSPLPISKTMPTSTHFCAAVH